MYKLYGMNIRDRQVFSASCVYFLAIPYVELWLIYQGFPAHTHNVTVVCRLSLLLQSEQEKPGCSDDQTCTSAVFSLGNYFPFQRGKSLRKRKEGKRRNKK